MSHSPKEARTWAEKRHPHLLVPTLFISSLPPSVKADVLIEAFKACDNVHIAFSHYSRWLRSGCPKTSSIPIEFTSIALAEKALATLHLRPFPNIEPPVPLILSITLNPAFHSPPQHIYPRLIRPLPADYDNLELYDLFRPFGPVASAQVESGLGGIVQFWKEEDACEAELNVKQILPRGQEITVQAFDPCNLFCTNLSLDITTNFLRTSFEELGHAIVSARVMAGRNGQSRGYGFISFRKPEEASAAMKAMDGIVVGSKPMIVRFHELKYPRHPNTTKDAESKPAKGESVDSITAVGDDDATSKDYREGPGTKTESWRSTIPMAEQTNNTSSNENVKPGVPDHQWTENESSSTTSLDEESRWQAEVTRLLAELEKLQADRTEYKRVAAEERGRYRAESDAENKLLRDRLRAEEERRKEAEESLRQAKAEQDTLRVEIEVFERQCAMAESRRKIAELEADRPLWEEARRKREMQEKARAEELRRQAEVAESHRKMREFMAQEAERKRAAEEARQEELRRRAAEERAKKEQEEAEQKAREKEERERKEKARLEALRRARNWKFETEKERTRCRQRDRKLWGSSLWTNTRALERFKSQTEEFDKIKFSETQPLTIEVVPWPVLDEPFDFEVEQLDWSMVEAFWASVKLEMAFTPAEYTSLLEKAHRMFHPDKWKSRGLLNTVLDEALRKSLEIAVNVVSQAITPLWRKSRGYD